VTSTSPTIRGLVRSQKSRPGARSPELLNDGDDQNDREGQGATARIRSRFVSKRRCMKYRATSSAFHTASAMRARMMVSLAQGRKATPQLDEREGPRPAQTPT
jgi:hypothetical protein